MQRMNGFVQIATYQTTKGDCPDGISLQVFISQHHSTPTTASETAVEWYKQKAGSFLVPMKSAIMNDGVR